MNIDGQKDVFTVTEINTQIVRKMETQRQRYIHRWLVGQRQLDRDIYEDRYIEISRHRDRDI